MDNNIFDLFKDILSRLLTFQSSSLESFERNNTYIMQVLQKQPELTVMQTK